MGKGKLKESRRGLASRSALRTDLTETISNFDARWWTSGIWWARGSEQRPSAFYRLLLLIEATTAEVLRDELEQILVCWRKSVYSFVLSKLLEALIDWYRTVDNLAADNVWEFTDKEFAALIKNGFGISFVQLLLKERIDETFLAKRFIWRKLSLSQTVDLPWNFELQYAVESEWRSGLILSLASEPELLLKISWSGSLGLLLEVWKFSPSLKLVECEFWDDGERKWVKSIWRLT